MEDILIGMLKDMRESAKEDRNRIQKNIDSIYEQLIVITRELGGLDKRLSALEKPEVKPKNTVDNSKLFLEWRKARVRVDSEGCLITVGDMWRSFRYWYDASPKNQKKLSQNVFMEEMVKVFGTPKEGKIYSGLFVFNTDEDVEAHDASKTMP